MALVKLADRSTLFFGNPDPLGNPDPQVNLFEFYVDGPLESYMKGVLAPESKKSLSHSFTSLGEDILILKRKEMKLYCNKLLDFSHENFLKIVACYDVYDQANVDEDDERYCCILFEDHLGYLHELGDLLFTTDSEKCSLSTLGRKYFFEIAKALDFLRVNLCSHGDLNMERFYLCDLTDEECKVKLGGLRGLLDPGDIEKAWATDLFNFGHSIECILDANDKTPDLVLSNYIGKLKGKSPATFLFSHALWLNLPRKKSLILELATIDDEKSLSYSYWPTDTRLRLLASADARGFYPKNIWGLINLLKDTILHPRWTTSYEGLTKDPLRFLEAVESRDPNMWIELLEVAAVVMGFGVSLGAEEGMYYEITYRHKKFPEEEAGYETDDGVVEGSETELGV